MCLPRQHRVESSHRAYTVSVARHYCWSGGVVCFSFHGGMSARKPNPLAITHSIVDLPVQATRFEARPPSMNHCCMEASKPVELPCAELDIIHSLGRVPGSTRTVTNNHRCGPRVVHSTAQPISRLVYNHWRLRIRTSCLGVCTWDERQQQRLLLYAVITTQRRYSETLGRRL